MQTTTAILIGAAMLSGAVTWNGERSIAKAIPDDARCAGYLASPSGGEALFRLSLLDVHSKRHRADMNEAELAALIAELQRRGHPIPVNAAAPDAPEKEGETEAALKVRLAEAHKKDVEARVFLNGLRLVGCRFNQLPDWIDENRR